MRSFLLFLFAFSFNVLNGNATSLSLLGNYSYSVSGNTVVLQADKIQNNAVGGYSGTIRLELWAFSSPYPGTTYGYKMASYTVGQLNGGYYYYNISSGTIPFTLPPPGTWYFSMQVREYTATGSDGYTTRDYGNFNTARRIAGGALAGDIAIVGQTSWQVTGTSVNLQVEKVSNICNLGTSGSLRLDLWATDSLYNGGTLSGYRFGSVPLNPLTGGYAYFNINQNVAYVKPPEDFYYVTLTVSEYHNGSWFVVDYLNYGDYQAFGTPPLAPVVKLATGLTGSGFSANWNSASRANGYLVDVSTSVSFSSYLPGYENKDVGNALSLDVTGLDKGMTYYYRVRAYNKIGTSDNSGTISVTTPCSYVITTSSYGNGTTTGGGIKGCGVTTTVDAAPSIGYRFVSWTENGSTVSESSHYVFDAYADRDLVANFADSQKPVVTITYPLAENVTFTNLPVELQGKATDNGTITQIMYQLNGGIFQAAVGTTTWSASVTAVPGTNTFTVKAIDSAGNESLLVTRHFFYSVRSPLALTIDPPAAGTVTRTFTGTNLEIGRRYSVTATAKPGYIFTSWSGNIATDAATLSFLMQPDLILQANFIPNPFIATKGTYNGLFAEADAVRQQSAGFVTMTLSTNGAFSGKIMLDGATNPFSGKLDISGHATAFVTRKGRSPLTNSLQLDVLADQINGTISSSNWTAQLITDRAVFNATTNKATAYAGKYTLAIPGGSNSATSPGGDGYATLSISTAGAVSVSGSLADGKTFRQSTSISKGGHWPFYVPLYSGKGSILGWVNFSNQLSSSLSGDLTWISPALPGAKYYPAGFTNETSAIGSSFLAPTNSTMKLLSLTNGVVIFSGGNLSETLTNDLIVNSNTTVTVSGTNRVVVTLNKTTGLLTGRFLNPATHKTNSFNGVVLQKQIQARGFFLGTNESGEVLLEGN